MKAFIQYLIALVLVSPAAFADSEGVNASNKKIADNLVIEMLKIRIITNCNQKVDSTGKSYVSTLDECRLEIQDQIDVKRQHQDFSEHVAFLRMFARTYSITLNS